MSYRKVIGVVAVALSTCACSTWNTLEAQSRVDPRTIAGYRAAGAPPPGTCDISKLRGDAYDVPINLDCFRFPEQAGQGDVAYVKAAGKEDSRNRLASILMKHSDDICVKEMGDVSAREAIANTTLGTATSALSGLASLVTGQRAKSWLAGGAGFTNATRDHVNAEVFRNVLASAIAKAIDNARVVERKQMEAQFDSKIPSYSVDQMIADVNRYHQICSFHNGIALVVDAVKRASPSVANDYRNMSAAISDLSMAIEEYDRRIADPSHAASAAGLALERAALLDRKAKLLVQRSALGNPAPKPSATGTGGGQ